MPDDDGPRATSAETSPLPEAGRPEGGGGAPEAFSPVDEHGWWLGQFRVEAEALKDEDLTSEPDAW